MTAYGFRSTASSLLNESAKRNPDAIESALSHADSDQVRSAYHRGAHWVERVEMSQWWSDYLEKLCNGETVFPFRQKL
jgi:integrase